MESSVVPSIMVLVLGDDVSLSSVADAVVAGAKRVRFTEVTTRATKADVFRHRTLEADASLASFDGIVFVASNADTAAREIERVGGTQSLANTVLSRAGAATGASVNAALVDLGGIVVSTPAAASITAHASAVGERVAKVAGWVRHSLGHEAEHHHHEHHGHSHDHHH